MKTYKQYDYLTQRIRCYNSIYVVAYVAVMRVRIMLEIDI
jgi:hypothetical protein